MSFSPPEAAQNAAKLGLELRDKFDRGGTEVGVARARDLSNGRNLSKDTVQRMVSFFARHGGQVDRRDAQWANKQDPSPQWIAWLLWGGDPGRKWANSVLPKEESTMNVDNLINDVLEGADPIEVIEQRTTRSTIAAKPVKMVPPTDVSKDPSAKKSVKALKKIIMSRPSDQDLLQALNKSNFNAGQHKVFAWIS